MNVCHRVGGLVAIGLALAVVLVPCGQAWAGFEPFDNKVIPRFDDYANVIAIDGDVAYVGGDFANVDELDAWAGSGEVLETHAIRRLVAIDLTNGEVFDNWLPNPDAQVTAIVVEGSKVYVGGQFKNLFTGGDPGDIVAQEGVAAFNKADGNAAAVLDPWNPVVDNMVRTIAISGTKVYLGGDFHDVNGTTRHRLAAVNLADASLDAAWDPNMGLGLIGDPPVSDDSSGVFVITIDGTTLYAGGGFIEAAGEARLGLVALNLADGASAAVLDTAWDPALDNEVRDVAILDDVLYVGGEFSQAGGLPRNLLAAFNTADGSSLAMVDPLWNPEIDGASLHTVLPVAGDLLYAGGKFDAVKGVVARNGVAAFSLADGSSAADVMEWDPKLKGYGPTSAAYLAYGGGTYCCDLVLYDSAKKAGNNDLMLAGDFTTVASEPASALSCFTTLGAGVGNVPIALPLIWVPLAIALSAAGWSVARRRKSKK